MRRSSFSLLSGIVKDFSLGAILIGSLDAMLMLVSAIDQLKDTRIIELAEVVGSSVVLSIGVLFTLVVVLRVVDYLLAKRGE